jgi:integrase
MASYRKTKSGWRVEVCRKGIRTSSTFLTKAEAKFWAAEKESELKGKATIEASNRTVGDLFERYRKEVSPTKEGARREENAFKVLLRYPLAKVFLDDVETSHLALFRDTRALKVKTSSVNRELSLISSVFTRAVKEWKWVTAHPSKGLSKLKAPSHRDRRVSDEELRLVLEGLKYEGVIEAKIHLVAAYFLFAIETAMRIGEICALKDEDFFDDHVVIRKSKNGDKRFAPLSTKGKALALLIKNSGLRVTADSASTLFRKVVRKQGIVDLHFHDSRHEGLTRLAGKLHVLELARVVGHRDLKSLMIYYNATPSELSDKLD